VSQWVVVKIIESNSNPEGLQSGGAMGSVEYGPWQTHVDKHDESKDIM
jgi:hypothetical protein